LHDSIAQNILLVKLNVGNYKRYFSNELDMEEYSRTLSILDTTLSEVRDIARNLRPVNIDELGLVTVIKSLCNNVGREAKLKYQLQMPENSTQLDKEVEICIYRILQESLNNIIRHSKAKSFSVDLLIEEDSVLFVLFDDGIGFKAKKLVNDKYISDGMGLMNMQESVERLNGSFTIESSYNQGTKIIAIFPITIDKNDGKPEYKNINS
jgi:signal transduction histidine kinase